jgi:hypothetical protein
LAENNPILQEVQKMLNLCNEHDFESEPEYSKFKGIIAEIGNREEL